MHVNLSRLSLMIAAATMAPGLAAAASQPTGLWIDHTGRGGVEITECGNALCGRLVWLKDAANEKACGTEIIGNVRPAGGGAWDGGWIYSPEKKQKYDVEIKPVGDDKLKVVGYAGTKLFSRTMTWTRAPDGLTRCGAKGAATTAAATAKPAPAASASGADASATPEVPTAGTARPLTAIPRSGEELATATGAGEGSGSDATKNELAASAANSPAVSKLASTPKDAKEPADKPKAGQQTAALDKPGKSGGSAKRRNDDDNDEPPRKRKMCKLEVPFVTVRIPCPD